MAYSASLTNLEVLIKGRPITKYMDRNGNTFVEGRKGSEYEIQISNPNHFKIKTVVAVDGLNILTGDTVWEKGYVVDARSTVVIPGWRIDASKVAKFEFSNLKGSYNSSAPANMGVIGVKVFNEKPAQPQPFQGGPWYQGTVSYDPSLFFGGGNTTYTFGSSVLRGVPGATGAKGPSGGRGMLLSSNGVYGSNAVTVAAPAPVNNVGTAWGDEQVFQTQVSEAEFYTYESEVLVLYYDDAKGLEARGIVVGNRRGNYTPDPFPNTDFGCKPPSN